MSTEMDGLIERLAAATGADCDLDAEIARAIGWWQDADGEWHAAGAFFPDGKMRVTSYTVDLPEYTASADAALTLVPDGAFVFSVEWDDEPGQYPLHACIMSPAKPKNIEEVAHLERPDDAKRGGWKKRLPILICLAALRARKAAP